MTNITLSIKDSTYRKMKEYSEIKWSEFVRKAIAKRIEQLEKLPKDPDDTFYLMLASENVLAKDWLYPANDVWDDV